MNAMAVVFLSILMLKYKSKMLINKQQTNA